MDDLVKEVRQGIDALHEKVEKHGKESSEVKAFQDKLAQDVKSFESFRQQAELSAKSQQERIDILEKHAAKLNAPVSFDAKVVCKALDEAVLRANKDGATLSELVKSRSVTDGAAGGNFVTEEMMRDMMITYIKDANPMLTEADVRIKANTAGIRFPKKTITVGDQAAVGEKQTAKNKTERKIQVVTMLMSRYQSYDQTTDEFLRAQDVENESTIISDVTQDLGVQIQFDALFGDGNSKLKGLLTESFLLQTAFVSAGQTGAATKITWKDLFNVQRQFNYEKYRNRGKFFLSYAALCDLLVEQDGEGRPIYMPGINGAAQSLLAGKPFVVMPDMDKVLSANTMPLLFGDMKAAYAIMLNNEYKIIRDEITMMDEGLIKIGVSTYAGGGVKDEEAIRAVKGS